GSGAGAPDALGSSSTAHRRPSGQLRHGLLLPLPGSRSRAPHREPHDGARTPAAGLPALPRSGIYCVQRLSPRDRIERLLDCLWPLGHDSRLLG
ncbi:hypothetical protein TGDOM2_236800B, partial [Toxoplasma gondii GAB2-2007-GAL-DOM2]